MFLGWHSIIFLQAKLNGRKTWPPRGGAFLPVEMFIGRPSIKFLQAMLICRSIGQKTWPPGGVAIWLYMAIVRTWNIFSSECVWPIFIFICRSVPWETLYQIPSIHVDWLKNMAARKRGYFALHGYSENLGWNFIGSILSMSSPKFLQFFWIHGFHGNWNKKNSEKT